MLFIDNKYTRWYYAIITNAQSRSLPKDTYTEKHHIIPKSLGGANTKDNLVKLTAREHFVCHMLLVKMVSSIDHARKMAFAAFNMTISTKHQKRYLTSWQYNVAKDIATRARIGSTRKPLTQEAKRNISNGNKGKVISDDTKAKMSLAKKGKTFTAGHRKNMSIARNLREPFTYIDVFPEFLHITKKEIFVRYLPYNVLVA